MENTNIYIILDEHKLEIVKGYNQSTKKIEPLKFEDFETANDYASINCDLWTILNVNFTSVFTAHRPNMTGTRTLNIHSVN